MRRRETLWVVRPGDGATVAEILRHARIEPSAVADGRVFVGKRRVTDLAQPVRVGDGVRIGAAAAASDAITILFQRDGLVACVKPAGLPTVPDHGGAAHALVARVAAAVGANDLRVTSRLDRDVSGVVVFALDAAAEERLRTARAKGAYRRRYVAIAAPARADRNAGAEGVWDAPIGRAHDPRLRIAGGVDAKEARTRWRAVAVAGDAILLAVDPETGRTHQIRVHAATDGTPLLGDRDYGGRTRLTLADGRTLTPTRIALHAARVVVPDARGEALEATAPIPPELASLWAALGGSGHAWTEAIT